MELCSGTIPKDFTIHNINRIKISCKFFSVDFNPIDSNSMLDINGYLMKRT